MDLWKRDRNLPLLDEVEAEPDEDCSPSRSDSTLSTDGIRSLSKGGGGDEVREGLSPVFAGLVRERRRSVRGDGENLEPVRKARRDEEEGEVGRGTGEPRSDVSPSSRGVDARDTIVDSALASDALAAAKWEPDDGLGVDDADEPADVPGVTGVMSIEDQPEVEPRGDSLLVRPLLDGDEDRGDRELLGESDADRDDRDRDTSRRGTALDELGGGREPARRFPVDLDRAREMRDDARRGDMRGRCCCCSAGCCTVIGCDAPLSDSRPASDCANSSDR